MKKMKKLLLSGILSISVIGGLLVTGKSLAFYANESANGQGKLVNEDGSQSQYSFNVRRNGNGKVTGQATLRNPSFRAGNGQNEQIKIDISCLKVVGNLAILGGVTKRKNNQASDEAVYFAVQDNGSSGAEIDKIFRGFFYDDDPVTKGDAQLCQTLEPEIFPLEPIAEGNIQVQE
jgi:hypothetical protein